MNNNPHMLTDENELRRQQQFRKKIKET